MLKSDVELEVVLDQCLKLLDDNVQLIEGTVVLLDFVEEFIDPCFQATMIARKPLAHSMFYVWIFDLCFRHSLKHQSVCLCTS